MLDRNLGLRLAAPLLLAGAALAVANCSSGTTPSVPPSVAASTSATTTATLGTTLTLAAVAGYTGTLSFTSMPSPTGVMVTSTGYNYAPPAALPTAPPAAFPTNPPGSQPSPSGGATPTVIVGWVFEPSAAVTVSSPAQTYTGIPAPAAGKSYYTYFGDMTAGTSFGYDGPGTYNPSTQSFSIAAGTNTTSLSANHWYVLEVVSF